jgi:hypothetical protein
MMNPTHCLFLLAGLTAGNYFLQGQLLQVNVVCIQGIWSFLLAGTALHDDGATDN